MRDLLEARLWAEHGHAFAKSVADLFAAANTGLQRLNAIQFDAPWRRGNAR
ncbi:MAG: hypothetical protein QOH81_3085 [Sphingomonadales bacterium]|jgi:hypothetical protein|nr:hypothetical protein [Sphingomonadales bacterium]